MAYKLDRTGDNVADLLTQVEEKTIYPDATQEAHGLLSAADKAKLDALPDVVYGTTAYWNSQPTYVPPAGRVVVYSDYSSKIVDGQTVYIPALKVGTGLAFVQELPFVGDVSIYGLGEAAYRDVATTVSQGSTNLPTGGAVHTAIGNAKSELEQEITSVAGDVNEISTKLTNDEGDIADLKLTAQGLQLDVRNAQGDITDLQIDARGIHSDIRNVNDDVTALDVRAGRLEVDMTNAQGDIHNLTVTTGELTSDISAVDGRVSTLKQTVDEISATVGNQQQDIAGLDVRAGEIELYAQGVAEDLGEYEDYMTGVLANMEKQIDGAIDTWFYDYAPVHTTQGVPDSTVPLMVVPYSDWYNADQQDPEHPEKVREEHVGDIFYDNTSGYAYRFTASGNAGSRVYAWSVITDSAVVKALADAARAQDTADHKRRVFVYSQQYPTPYAPYDVGDLWVKNVEVYVPPRGSAIIGTTINTRILYKCKTARSRTSDTFPYNPAVNTDTSSVGCDWEPANDNPLEIANANLQLLSDAIVGKVGAYTYDANGVLTVNSQSLIQQQAHSIILEVTGNELDTVGIYINNPSQSDNNITLQAGKIFFQGAESQNHKTAMSFIWDPNAGQNGDWKITAANLDVNGIFSTSAWDAEELALQQYAQNEADGAESAAKTYAEGEADSAEAAAKAYAKEYADNVGNTSVTSAETYFNNIVYGNGGSAQEPTSGSILYTLNNFDVELNDPTTGLAAQVTAIDQGLTDLGYLAEALFDGDTVVAGGLILSSLIQLGSKHNNSTGTDSPVDDTITQATWRVWSGLNGVYNSSAYGGGIAGWYGGAMLDRHYPDNTDLNRAAKTLFRFDGSGYLASNNIYWDAAGNLTINGYTLTNEIQLKDSSSNVTAGISGLYDNSTGSAAWGHGIAAWFGGPKVDKYAGSSVPASYAKSLFRMDGSGYLASGNISWGAAGEIAIHDATLYDNNGQVSIAQILALCSWFSVEEYETNKFRLKVNLSESGLDGLYVGGYLISAGDQIVVSGTPGGGSGGGAGYLYELGDVLTDSQNTHVKESDGTTNAANGDIFAYNGSKWYALKLGNGLTINTSGSQNVLDAAGTYTLPLAASGTRGGIQIGYSESGTNYAVKLSSEKAYVTVPWTDTKNTAGADNTTSKIFLVGPTAQTTSNGSARTYSNVNCYAQSGKLYSNSKEVVNLSDSQALTNKTYNGYTLAAACAKSVANNLTTASSGSAVLDAYQGKVLNDKFADYVKLDPGAAEQTIKSSIGTLAKGVINFYRSSGDHYTFLGFSNGTTETFLGGIGFKSQSDSNLYHQASTKNTYYKIWDENNDGSGSGLNADLLDGQHASYFAPAVTGGYLPLSGGVMTGELVVATGLGISDASGNGLLVYHPSDWTGITNIQWGVGATDAQGVIRSSNANLIHYKGGTSYTIWDAGNSGTTSYEWSASKFRTDSLEMRESSSRMCFGTYDQAAAAGVNVGSLLVSNAWADYAKVPTNGIYSKGSIRASSIMGWDTASSSTATWGIYDNNDFVTFSYRDSSYAFVGAAFGYSAIDGTITIEKTTTHKADILANAAATQNIGSAAKSFLRGYINEINCGTGNNLWLETNSSNKIYFTNGNTSSILGNWSSSGLRVGDGTASTATLDVRGNGTVTGNLEVDGNIYLGTNNKAISVKDTGGTLRRALWMYTDNSLLFGYETAEAGYTSYLDGNNVYIRTGTGHTTGIYVKSNGNVGIGNTDPDQKLHVSGGVKGYSFTTDMGAYAQTLSSAGWYRVARFLNDTTGNLRLCIQTIYYNNQPISAIFDISCDYMGVTITQTNGTFLRGSNVITSIRVVKEGGYAWVEIYYNYNMSNVVYVSGFGDATFFSPVASSGTVTVRETLSTLSTGISTTGGIMAKGNVFASAYYGSNADSATTVTNRWGLYQWKKWVGFNRRDGSNNHTANVLGFDVDTGNVGIGNVSSSSYPLYVSGTTRIDRCLRISGATTSTMTTATTNPRIVFAENDTTQAVGIVYTDFDAYRSGKGLKVMDVDGQDPNVWFEVAGTIISSGDQVVSSDATKKRNWQPLSYGVEDIAKCTAGTFEWIADGRKSAGSKAQDWKGLVPELVHGEVGNMTLAYGQIALLNTVLLARHESEQDEEIHRLRELVNELENEVRRLRS